MNRKSLIDWAIEFTGDPASFRSRGDVLVKLMQREGMQTDSQVLEIGCGALSAGIPLMEHLNPGCYVGMEPMSILVEAAIRDLPGVADLISEKQPDFVYRDDFDASELGRTYDIICAHSVLSHCAQWQLPLLLSQVRRVLRPDGKFLCSYRQGKQDTMAGQWVYPGVAYFTARTIRHTARQQHFKALFRRGYKSVMTRLAERDTHDWVLFQRIPRTWSEFTPFSDDDLRLSYGVEDEEARSMLLGVGVGRMVERAD